MILAQYLKAKQLTSKLPVTRFSLLSQGPFKLTPRFQNKNYDSCKKHTTDNQLSLFICLGGIWVQSISHSRYSFKKNNDLCSWSFGVLWRKLSVFILTHTSVNNCLKVMMVIESVQPLRNYIVIFLSLKWLNKSLMTIFFPGKHL